MHGINNTDEKVSYHVAYHGSNQGSGYFACKHGLNRHNHRTQQEKQHRTATPDSSLPRKADVQIGKNIKE